MTVATVTQAPVAAAKLTAGDLAIAAAQKAGHTNKTLLKAVWSTRGAVRVPTVGFEFGVSIIKSDLTRMLQVLPADDQSAFILTPMADGGALLTPVAAEAAAE